MRTSPKVLGALALTGALLAAVPATAQEDLPDEPEGGWLADAFGLTTTLTGTTGIDPYDPLLATDVTLQPSLKLTSSMSLLGELAFSKEYTNGETSEYREGLYSDLKLGAAHTHVASIAGVVTLGANAAVYLPTSENSWLRGLDTALRLGGTATAAGGPVTGVLSAAVQKNFYEATTMPLHIRECAPATTGDRSAVYDRSDPAALGSSYGEELCYSTSQLSSWSAILGATAVWAVTTNLGLSVTWAFLDSFGYDTATSRCDGGTIDVAGCPGGGTVPHDAEMDSHKRFAQLFAITADYVFTPQLTLSAALSNGIMSQRWPDTHSFRSPLVFYWDRTNSTTVAASLAWTL